MLSTEGLVPTKDLKTRNIHLRYKNSIAHYSKDKKGFRF